MPKLRNFGFYIVFFFVFNVVFFFKNIVITAVGSIIKKKYLNKLKIFKFYIKNFYDAYSRPQLFLWWNTINNKKSRKKLKKYEKIFAYYLNYVRAYIKTDAVNFQKMLLLGQIKCNDKQYFFSTLGVTFKYFQTVSMGKLLAKEKITAKAAKKSKKYNKLLLEYYSAQANTLNARFGYYYLKPINIRNINLWYAIQAKYKPKMFILGGLAYYKTVTKKAARIKKKIKKKILASSTFYKV